MKVKIFNIFLVRKILYNLEGFTTKDFSVTLNFTGILLTFSIAP